MALSVTLVVRNGPCLSGCHADMELELIKKCFWLKRSKGLIVADDGVCGAYAAPVKVEMSEATDDMWTTCRFACRSGDVSGGQKTKRGAVGDEVASGGVVVSLCKGFACVRKDGFVKLASFLWCLQPTAFASLFVCRSVIRHGATVKLMKLFLVPKGGWKATLFDHVEG